MSSSSLHDAGAALPKQPSPIPSAAPALQWPPGSESQASTRRLGVRDFKRLTRRERRAIRYTQLQLSLLNRRKKRVDGGWVSLEVDKSVRASIEQHMRRRK